MKTKTRLGAGFGECKYFSVGTGSIQQSPSANATLSSAKLRATELTHRTGRGNTPVRARYRRCGGNKAGSMPLGAAT